MNGLFVQELGQGRPLVLLHAVGTSSALWREHLPRLSKRFRVLALDLPGHGHSPREPEPLSLEGMAEAVTHTLHARGATPAHLLGLSIGGMVAMYVAVYHPEAVASLILCDTTCELAPAGVAALQGRARAVEERGMAGTAPATIERWFAPGSRESRPAVVAEVEAQLLAADPVSNGQAWMAITRLDIAARLQDVHVPALVINGELDTSIPPGAGERLSQLLRARLLVLPGCSHVAPLEAPEAFLTAVEEFLSTRDGPAETGAAGPD